MANPFKMKGMSFGNSPMKQDKSTGGKKLGNLAGKLGKYVKDKKSEKFMLSSSTNAKTGETEYFKVSGGSSTDGGKTFAPSVKTKISKDTYSKMKGNK